MSTSPPQLPPKPEVALALLQSAPSVYIHLDPRSEAVVVPVWFKKQPQLVLQVGLNMTVSIPDLDVGDEGISCTLSFNRRPEYCSIPWSAIFGLVGEDGRGMIWPDSVPSEVAASANGRAPLPPRDKPKRAKLRLASRDGADSSTSSELERTKTDRSSPEKAPEAALDAPGAAPEKASSGDSEEAAQSSPKRPPHLRLVK